LLTIDPVLHLGFIPDVCQYLFKYELHDIVNNLLSPQHNTPSKFEWKSGVKNAILREETYLWDQRMAADSYFAFFRILQPAVEPAVVYKVSNISLYRNSMLVIARLWTRPVTLENQLCLKCNNTYQDELVHVTCECPSKLALRNQLTDSLASILLPDELLRVLELDSVSQTLRFLGAPVETIFDMPSETLFLRNTFAFIVNCIQAYFEHWWYLYYHELNAKLTAVASDINSRLVVYNDSANCLTILLNAFSIICYTYFDII